WRVVLDRAGDRVAMRSGQPVDRALGKLLDEVQPSDLSPLLHADHTLLLARSLDQARVRDQPDDVRLSARWSSFQPAQVVQYSGGAHNSVPRVLIAESRVRGLDGLSARRPYRLSVLVEVGCRRTGFSSR